jgi:hypothetical protein
MDQVHCSGPQGLCTFIKWESLVFGSTARIGSGEGVFHNLILSVGLRTGGREQRQRGGGAAGELAEASLPGSLGHGDRVSSSNRRGEHGDPYPGQNTVEDDVQSAHSCGFLSSKLGDDDWWLWGFSDQGAECGGFSGSRRFSLNRWWRAEGSRLVLHRWRMKMMAAAQFWSSKGHRGRLYIGENTSDMQRKVS